MQLEQLEARNSINAIFKLINRPNQKMPDDEQKPQPVSPDNPVDNQKDNGNNDGLDLPEE